MKQETAIMYSFFERLRKDTSIELDAAQYRLFLKALALGKGWGGKQELFELCQMLWLSRERYAKDFKRIFEEEYPKYFEEVKETENSENTERQHNKQAKRKEDTSPLTEESVPRERPENKNKESLEKPREEAQTSPFGQAHLNFAEKENSRREKEDVLGVEDTYLKHKFTFANKFLPVTDRELGQIWRRFRNATVEVPSEELDVGKMVDELVQEHRISRLWYESRKQNVQEVVLILDHSHTMSAFSPLAQQLYRTLSESQNFTKVTRLYFRGLPYINEEKEQRNYKLFFDPYHYKSLTVSKYWCLLDKSTLVLFFSDARQKIGMEASIYFWEMLQQMRRHTPCLAWISPLSEERWPNSNAAYLQSFIQFVEYNKKGFKQLTKTMHETPPKGHPAM